MCRDIVKSICACLGGGGQREWVSNRVEYRPCVVPVRTRHSIEWYRVGTWKILLFAFIRKINTKTMEEQWSTVIKLCVCFPNELDVQIKQSLAPTSVSTFNLPSYLLRSSQLGSSGTKISLIRKWILQTSSSASPNACECVWRANKLIKGGYNWNTHLLFDLVKVLSRQPIVGLQVLDEQKVATLVVVFN